MNYSFLKEQLVTLQAPSSWVTRITDVSFVSRDEALVTIDRPNSGTGVSHGGVIRAYTLDGKIVVEQKVPQTSPPRRTAEHSLKDPKLDFNRNSYIIGYGPDNVDQNVNSMATSVKVSPDIVFDFQGSLCIYRDALNNRVTAQYSVPRSFDNIGSMRVYVVEGSELKDSTHAIQNQIAFLKSDSPPSDIVRLNYEDGTFEVGKTYTICLNVYSWTREIAGQAFIFS